MVRSAGEMDSALAARLETIAEGLGQITELRAEVEGLRAIVEKLAQSVSALIVSREAEAGAPEQANPGGGDGVMIFETHGVSAPQEEEQPELKGVA